MDCFGINLRLPLIIEIYLMFNYLNWRLTSKSQVIPRKKKKLAKFVLLSTQFIFLYHVYDALTGLRRLKDSWQCYPKSKHGQGVPYNHGHMNHIPWASSYECSWNMISHWKLMELILHPLIMLYHIPMRWDGGKVIGLPLSNNGIGACHMLGDSRPTCFS